MDVTWTSDLRPRGGRQCAAPCAYRCAHSRAYPCAYFLTLTARQCIAPNSTQRHTSPQNAEKQRFIVTFTSKR